MMSEVVLGQHGGVGRAEGRNAILVTRTGWERAEKGPEGRSGTGRCLEKAEPAAAG